MWLRLFDVHFRGAIGSPRVAGSTIPSRAGSNDGCFSGADFRPPPGRRCRPPTTPRSGPRGSPCSSRLPCKTVMGLICSASAIARTPPRPNDSASLAAHSRFPLSSKCGFSRSYFSRTPCFRSSRTCPIKPQLFLLTASPMVLKHGLGPPFFRILPACFITRTSICLVPIVVFQVICGRLLRLATPPCGPSPVTVPCRGMPCASASDWPASVVLIIRPGSTPITVDLRIGESSRKGQGSTSKRTSQPLTGLFPERQGVKRHRSSHVRKGVASQPYGRRSRKVEIKDRQELAHEINRAIRSRPGETSCQICGISETSQGRTNPLTHARMCQEATRTLQQGSPPLLIFADANL